MFFCCSFCSKAAISPKKLEGEDSFPFCSNNVVWKEAREETQERRRSKETVKINREGKGEVNELAPSNKQFPSLSS